VKPNQAVEQPISVSVSIIYDVSPAARTDDLFLSLDYSVLTKSIRKCVESQSFSGLRDVSRHISDALATALVDFLDGLQVHLKVVQLKSPLYTKTVSIEHLATFRSDRSWVPSQITHFVEDLSCSSIIGVNPHERVEKQDVVVNLAIESDGHGFDGEAIDFRLITRTLCNVSGFSDVVFAIDEGAVYSPGNFSHQLSNSRSADLFCCT
jgi:FolB domain-containing protein